MTIADVVPVARIVDVRPVERWIGGGPSSVAAWPYRKKIAIQTAYLDANLTDFPLYVPIKADTDIGNCCRADGFDIRFMAADGVTLLKHERVSFNVAAGAATGEFWVKCSPQTAGTYIYVYYGSPWASDGADPANVWDANFKAVYHMNDNPDTSHIVDSTGNANNGTKKAEGVPAETTGQVGKGQNFNSGLPAYLSANPATSLDITAALTISLWIKPTTNPTWATLVTKGISDDWNATNYTFGAQSGRLDGRWNGKGTILADIGDALSVGAWQHVAFTIAAGTTNALALYKAGLLIKQGNRSGDPATNSQVLRIGSDVGEDNANAVLDEIRVSSVARPAAWLKFEYRNMAEADNELTWGGQEGLWQ